MATETPNEPPPWGVDLVTICAVVCYLAEKSSREDSWQQKSLHLLIASLAICGVTALAVQGLTTVTSLIVHPAAHHLAFVRTLALCAVVLVLAFGGAHWRRPELTWLAFGFLALVALKLIAEDLRHGHLGYTAASICLVAITPIAVPRAGRVRSEI